MMGSEIKKSCNLEFGASKIMKSGFYYASMKQNKSIKLLKVLFKYIVQKWLKNGNRYYICSYDFLVTFQNVQVSDVLKVACPNNNLLKIERIIQKFCEDPGHIGGLCKSE